ncbi:MAG: isochorismatase family protein [Anaerolineales bacterium]|nr:isochorismatase family protein [Anaerolineales bacterium]
MTRPRFLAEPSLTTNALLIIDMQRGFFEKVRPSQPMPGQAMIPPLLALLGSARQPGIPIGRVTTV